MNKPLETTARIKIDVGSTEELANQVREHIESHVVRALADDETMRTYVVRALTEPGKRDPKPNEWLRDVIDRSIRAAAADIVQTKVRELHDDIEQIAVAYIDANKKKLVGAVVDRFMTVR